GGAPPGGGRLPARAAPPARTPAVSVPERPLDEYSARVLDVVDAIPPGQVMSYGDIAEYLGSGGPRQVGKVLATYGGGVAWWRVIYADGTPAPGHESTARRHSMSRGTPLPSGPPPVRVAMRPSPGSPT